jgi:glycosyltransferase involved in cell wall biosynthesis
MKQKFVIATPFRTTCDLFARVLAKHDLLRGYFVGNRRGTKGIPGELTVMNPIFGYWMMGTRKILPTYYAEWCRAAIHPLYDRWARTLLKPGDHVMSSYGYANCCFSYAREHGGKTFVDGGNSHPENFWNVVSEENKKWGRKYPPYPPIWNRRARRMMPLMDYLISPSSYVTETFTSRGFPEDHIMQIPFPADLSLFHPPESGFRPPGKKLRVICTGSVGVRKGFPYLLEAMRIICKKRDVILLLTNQIDTGFEPILRRFSDVPIEWGPTIPHDKLGERLHSADVFALLSLEDGFALTVTEALACGLPAVVTTNTGARDCIQPGVNGEIVPIRDAQAAADAILRCADRLENGPPPLKDLQNDLSFETYEKRFMSQLEKLNLS